MLIWIITSMMKILNASIPNSVIKLVYPLIVNWLYVGVLRLLISHEFLPPMAFQFWWADLKWALTTVGMLPAPNPMRNRGTSLAQACARINAWNIRADIEPSPPMRPWWMMLAARSLNESTRAVAAIRDVAPPIVIKRLRRELNLMWGNDHSTHAIAESMMIRSPEPIKKRSDNKGEH